jgi:hypothetical protein
MNLLNQKCNIDRMVTTKNAQMQSVKTWVSIVADLACNIQYQSVPANNFEQGASGLVATGKFIGFFDTGVDLKKGDRITWTAMELFVDGFPFPVYAGNNIVHHIEASLGVEAT